MKAYLVEYTPESGYKQQIVIHCNSRSDVRGILKKHLDNKPFTINRITERSVNA